MKDRAVGKGGLQSKTTPVVAPIRMQSIPLRKGSKKDTSITPRTRIRKEKLRRSQKVIQAHKQKFVKELAECDDPVLAIILTAIYEENIYQQNLSDLIRVCIHLFN